MNYHGLKGCFETNFFLSIFFLKTVLSLIKKGVIHIKARGFIELTQIILLPVTTLQILAFNSFKAKRGNKVAGANGNDKMPACQIRQDIALQNKLCLNLHCFFILLHVRSGPHGMAGKHRVAGDEGELAKKVD
ncbi:hypothetical protein NC651_007646 [Populus alba x Populus x berolinensis]|nr:hypothetical protein NC651_007646 [Populus alba x Populus x berolinensis]